MTDRECVLEAAALERCSEARSKLEAQVAALTQVGGAAVTYSMNAATTATKVQSCMMCLNCFAHSQYNNH